MRLFRQQNTGKQNAEKEIIKPKLLIGHHYKYLILRIREKYECLFAYGKHNKIDIYSMWKTKVQN